MPAAGRRASGEEPPPRDGRTARRLLLDSPCRAPRRTWRTHRSCRAGAAGSNPPSRRRAARSASSCRRSGTATVRCAARTRSSRPERAERLLFPALSGDSLADFRQCDRRWKGFGSVSVSSTVIWIGIVRLLEYPGRRKMALLLILLSGAPHGEPSACRPSRCWARAGRAGSRRGRAPAPCRSSLSTPAGSWPRGCATSGRLASGLAGLAGSVGPGSRSKPQPTGSSSGASVTKNRAACRSGSSALRTRSRRRGRWNIVDCGSGAGGNHLNLQLVSLSGVEVGVVPRPVQHDPVENDLVRKIGTGPGPVPEHCNNHRSSSSPSIIM